jgi:hypothetical protein
MLPMMQKLSQANVFLIKNSTKTATGYETEHAKWSAAVFKAQMTGLHKTYTPPWPALWPSGSSSL